MNTTTQSQKPEIKDCEKKVKKLKQKKYKLKIVKSLIFTDYELKQIGLIKCWGKLGAFGKGKFSRDARKTFGEDWVKLQEHFIDEYEHLEMVKKNKEAEREIEEYVSSLRKVHDGSGSYEIIDGKEIHRRKVLQRTKEIMKGQFPGTKISINF